MNAFALPRLLARPVVLWMLVPLFWAVVLPYASAHDHGAPLGMPGAGGPGGGWQYAAWQLALLVPAVVGFTVALSRLELQHAAFSWSLPALQRSVLAGVLLIAVPLAAASAVVVARSTAGDAISVGVAGFAVAMFAFAVAFVLPDAVLPRALRYTLPLLLLAAAFRPDVWAGMVAAAPWAVAAVTLTAATALLRISLSKEVARRRHARWSAFAPHRTVMYWATQPSPDVRWTQSLATDRVLPWLRAVMYASRHPRIPFVGFMLFLVTIAGLSGYIINSPVQVLIIGGISLVQGRPWLNAGMFYPLSRRRRADVMTAALVAEGATLALLLTLVGAAFAWLSVAWPGPFADDATSVSWTAAVGMTVAFAPLAQWSRILWPVRDRYRLELRPFALLMAFYVPAILVARAMTGLDLATVAGTSLGIAIIGYTVLWAAARRHYDRVDLVRRAA
jgi:hypothetical protein